MTNTNTSATGGPLIPSPAPAPLEGQALNRFLQQWMAGILDIDPTLVRPAWQGEPANIPEAGSYWVAFRVLRRVLDWQPAAIQHKPPAPGHDLLLRHESLFLHTQFFDLGVNGQADYLCSLLADGIQISQNREVLQLAGYGLVEGGNPTPAPVLFKQRWQYRVDLEIHLRRMIQRIYPVEDLLSAHGTILFDGGEPPVPWQTRTP